MKNAKIWLLCLLVLSACSVQREGFVSQFPIPNNLLVEGNSTPLNVHSASPRLSWHSNVAHQVAYQIQVAQSMQQLELGNADLWDSGVVKSKQSINVEYQGRGLTSGNTAFWRVRVWHSLEEESSEWSGVSRWEMGLRNAADWQANWITANQPYVAEKNSVIEQWVALTSNQTEHNKTAEPHVLDKLTSQPTATLFRRQFSLSKKVVKARLHSTAAGYYEVYLNGRNIDDRLMDPGQTDFDKRILYNTDDVIEHLVQGENVIAVHLGSGWYDEDIAFSKWTNPDASGKARAKRSLAYGQPAFIAQLELTYSDGASEIVKTDGNWLSHASPIVKEGIFSGELYDSNRMIPGWNSDAELETTNWQTVRLIDSWPTQLLEPQLQPAIKAVKEVKPRAIYQPQPGVWVFDFGQNFTGIPTLNLDALHLVEGQAIHLRYAEWVDRDHNISQKSGGSAPLLKQVDTYVASKDSQGSWTPLFTWHGFRYVEVTGLTEKPDLSVMTAHLLRSAVERAGVFVSSDPLLNRIHEMALWGYESNLMALPMDCPIRERAGWTGDAHAALITGNYNYDMNNFWAKYLGDFRTAQHVAPAVVPGKRTHGGNFDWAVAEVLIAWEHYRHHGDIQVLRDQYDSLLEYMHAAESTMQDGLLRKGYGDWCDVVRVLGADRVNGRCAPEHTSPVITSSALLAHGADLMAKIAGLLDQQSDSEHYQQLFSTISTQFHREFYNPETGHYGSQTADAMALQFGITPLELRQTVADALNNDVLQNWNGHASVGALGQTYLYRALSDYGYADTAFNIFKAEGYPGYSFLINDLNATTLWERKGGFDPNADPTGKRAPGRSLNHPFHTGYDGWFYEGLGGIRPLADSVGYQQFELNPHFVTRLDWVDVSYTTGYGEIESHWQRKGGVVHWQFTIPNNSSAWVYLPNQPKTRYSAGKYQLEIVEK